MNVARTFFGYLAFSAGFLEASNAPANIDSKCLDSRCPVPEGDFLKSCIEPKTDFYPSSDPLVPGTCKLTITCNTIYESMPPITGHYYLPMLTLITGVSNINGTLYKDGSALGKPKKPEPMLDPEKLDPKGESTLDGPKLDWYPR